MTAGASAKSSRTPLLLISAILLIALAIGGVLQLAQGDSDDSGGLPSPEDLPSGVVAVVSGAPASMETVTRAEFEHALEMAAAAADLEGAPEPGDKRYGELKEAAMGELLDAIWIASQAGEMGISVTAQEVADELAKLRKQSFDTNEEYEDFLAESHYSDADVDGRVRTQLFSTAIQQRIQDRADSGQSAQQEELAKFVKRYQSRWRTSTVCRPELAIERCSNGKQPKGQSAWRDNAPPD